ncbi:hypothetical protein JRQ81_004117 [Phrynocephalus forsythii]|uniref:Uncharacterized protein n=1 Tax=Phrynocephalus forsythii TaxID=171643 RepID=A0A9Q1AY33_9SAUR|nr:hypothetical protein JRQ81_004117 [Phrynocephalus forsythii]
MTQTVPLSSSSISASKPHSSLSGARKEKCSKCHSPNLEPALKRDRNMRLLHCYPYQSHRSSSRKVVQVVTNNMTTMYYINKQGGTHSPRLLHLSVAFWEWCMQQHIYPIAIHLSGSINTKDDCLPQQI